MSASSSSLPCTYTTPSSNSTIYQATIVDAEESYTQPGEPTEPSSSPPINFASDILLRRSFDPTYTTTTSSIPPAIDRGNHSASSQQIVSHVLANRAQLKSSDPTHIQAESATQHFFTEARTDDHDLKDFFDSFPLGGDLHNHLCGAIWSEDWLRLAESYSLFFLHEAGAFTFSNEMKEGYQPIKEMTGNQNLVDQFNSVCSMRGASTSSVDECSKHFFKSFHCFESIARHIPIKDQLECFLKKAILGNMDYVELMVDIIDFKDLPPLPEEFTNEFNTLYSMNNHDRLIELLTLWTLSYCSRVQEQFDATEKVDCQELLDRGFDTERNLTNINNPLVMRYIVDTSRLYDNCHFYVAIFAAIKLCQSDPRFVGITISGPEHDWNAIQNFNTQMAIIKLLSTKLEFRNFNLHAGELVKTLAEPFVLATHIKDSIDAGSRRIGHAACLSDSRNWRQQLIPQMKREGICVEVCVSSNKKILNLKNGKHPINQLRKHTVPFVLCSDDSGVTRSELKDEFRKVAKRYQDFDYKAFKKLSRNSISFSFLPGESIYRNTTDYTLKPLFSNLMDLNWKPSIEQNQFLKGNDKARLEARLIRKFVLFENVTILQKKSMYNASQITD